MKKVIALLLVLLLALPAMALAETYTAEAPGFGGAVTVTLTVEDGKITDATVTGDSETPEVGGAALEPLAAQLVAAGNAEIDGVTGATFTSNAVKEAAAAALAQLGGEGATETALTDGEYTAEAIGFDRGLTDKVTVTIADGKITEIAFGEDCGSTPPMLDTVQNTLFPRIIENQSTGVDSLTGATVTSNAAKQAIDDCLTQAGADLAAFHAIPEKKGGEEEITTQVLVIGMGGSGTYAALRAQESGAQVLAIEKQARYGGTTALTSEIGVINVGITQFRSDSLVMISNSAISFLCWHDVNRFRYKLL